MKPKNIKSSFMKIAVAATGLGTFLLVQHSELVILDVMQVKADLVNTKWLSVE